MLIEVYAEKTNDGDVIITRENGEPFAIFRWFDSWKPDRRNKYITLNCYKWRLIWKEGKQ